jgi:hypothetical protein
MTKDAMDIQLEGKPENHFEKKQIKLGLDEKQCIM